MKIRDPIRKKHTVDTSKFVSSTFGVPFRKNERITIPVSAAQCITANARKRLKKFRCFPERILLVTLWVREIWGEEEECQ